MGKQKCQGYPNVQNLSKIYATECVNVIFCITGHLGVSWYRKRHQFSVDIYYGEIYIKTFESIISVTPSGLFSQNLCVLKQRFSNSIDIFVKFNGTRNYFESSSSTNTETILRKLLAASL